jgi:hypothetical protein
LRVMRRMRPLKFVALRLMTGTGGRRPDLAKKFKILKNSRPNPLN